MSLDRDRIISLALSPEPTLSAPADLAERISQAVRETPQRRPLLPTQVFRPLVPAPVLRMLLLTLLMLALLGFSLVILSRPPGPEAGVLMYHGGPERTGVLPGPGPAGEPFIAWQAVVAGPVPFSLMPIVADGRVIVGDQDGGVHALDETSGALLWTESLGVRASPLIIGDLVLAGLDSGGVVAVRAADGREVWRFGTEAPVSASLVAVDETVYVASEDGIVHALDAASGEARWMHDVGETVNRGAAVSSGILYVVSYGGRFSAIDGATGEGLWRVELGPGEVSTPIVSGGRAYVGRSLDSDPSLVALDVADGGQLWEFRSALRLQVRPGALASDQLYV
ncbi:MAG: PQQ-binding-like beta-propeller repeat protein, partial [Chloroflexota bacterium]|nr:PQQ-binding-like beta-propeller repeat protein [Chloroflexota bacterium]